MSDHVHGPNCNHGQQQQRPAGTVQVNDAQQAPPLFKSIASYLRDEKQSAMRTKQGVINGKRIEYFKGKSAVNALLKENFAKVLPKDQQVPKERSDAIVVLNELGKLGFILCVSRGDYIGEKHSPRQLAVAPTQEMNENNYYVWLWEGPKWGVYLRAGLLIAGILTAVLFPLWPSFLRLGVWYLSMGVLGLLGVFFGIAIVRLILYVLSLIVLPRGFWLFPNLFADCGVIESFIPFYGWDEPKAKKSPSSTSTTVNEKSAGSDVTHSPRSTTIEAVDE
ncbi:translocation protein [Hesseltinella vesiculosa]|uniref:Translocation protein SEC62 n=1 Tax=Hesseltinella vesiculosa TaxID=101127 RepID=A0A1X2GUR6_9FUNG|nr:translocation protein [Hesseltinella vesiculosa]